MFGLSNLFNRKPTRDRFARDVLTHLQTQSPEVTGTVDPSRFRIQTSDGQTIFLDNAFIDYCKAPAARRQDIIREFLAGLKGTSLPHEFSDAKANLLPVLRHVSGLENVLVEAQKTPPKTVWEEFPMRRFSPDLAVGIAFDTEHAVQHVGEEHLARWGKTVDQALEVAIDNLRDRSPSRFAPHAPGLYVSRYGDYYDATRILLPELAWQLPLRGAPVAMVPNRAVLLMTGDADEEGMAALVATAEQVLLEDSRPLGSEMFRLEDREWKVWHPDGASGDRLHNLQLRVRAADYASQKQALERVLQQKGEDIFVATYSVVQRDGSPRFHSLSVLTKGADSLLPKTDVLALHDLEAKETITVSWSDFERIAGRLLDPQPQELQRYRVTGFPTDIELGQLRLAQAAP